METRLQNDPGYRRLRAARWNWRTTSYWLAPDHLLIVDAVGVMERYRRFDLRDLEMLILHPTSSRRIAVWILAPTLAILAGVTAFLGYLALTSTTEYAGIWALISAFPTFLLAGALAWVVLPGPFCETQLRTGVQTLSLSGLIRLPIAERFANELGAAVAGLDFAGPSPRPESSATPGFPTAEIAAESSLPNPP